MHVIEKLTLLKAWLSMELEKLGIDCSKLYARHLLDIFLNSDTYTNDLQLNKREQTIFYFANDCSKKNISNGKSGGGGATKAWKGGDSSSQSSSSPISSNQPPLTTQPPTNHHHDWKKQEALNCLLGASHDDALQDEDFVDKLKKLIEKLHLSVEKLNEIKKEKLIKKPKENYNQAFPNSLNFLPMQKIDICNTAWKNYQISKKKETGIKPAFSHSKPKHEVVLKRLKARISPGSNKALNNSHRVSTRERRHPYVKQKESNVKQHKQNFNNHKRNNKSKYEIKNHGKKKSSFSKKSSLAKHYFTRSSKLSFHKQTVQNKNAYHKSDHSSSGDRWNLNKKFTEKLQLESSQSNVLNDQNYEILKFKKLTPGHLFTKEDTSSIFINKLKFRNDENNNFYDFEDNSRFPTNFQKNKKYVYPSHKICYKKDLKLCKTTFDVYSGRNEPENEVSSHYYLPESISKELNNDSDSSNITQDSPIVSSGISKWYRDPNTGILNFVPAENSSFSSSSKLFNDKDQYWKSCPSPSLWDNEYDSKSVDISSGRASKLKTIYSSFNNLSNIKTTKTESIWTSTNSVLNEVNNDQNTFGAGGDHGKEKTDVSNVFYCTGVKLDSNLNPFTSKSSNSLLKLENDYYANGHKTTFSTISDDSASIYKKCSSLYENSWVNGASTMPDKENIWSNPNDCGNFGSFLYKNQSTPYILESSKTVSSNLLNDSKIPSDINNFDSLRLSHLNNSFKVNSYEPWSSLVTYNKQADKFNFDFNPEVCGKENIYEYSSKASNIWNQDSVCSAFTSENLRSSASSSMIDFESCWLDESAISNDKTVNSFHSSVQDNSNNFSSFAEIKQPNLHESIVSRHTDKQLNLTGLSEKDKTADHDDSSGFTATESCTNDQRDYILKLVVDSVFDDETEKSDLPPEKDSAKSKEASVWDYSVYDSKKDEFYEQQREDRKDINELLSLINSSVLNMNNLTLSEPLTKVTDVKLEEPKAPLNIESKNQWNRNDITKELNNYVQSYIVDSNCNESFEHHPSINANFNNEINWMSTFYPSTLSSCYNSTLDNSFSSSMNINSSAGIWKGNQSYKEIWAPAIKKESGNGYESYEDKFIPVPFDEAEAKKITIPDWFDIEMVMRDHQNINVEGVNFSCARCWSNENIELEVSEIMQAKMEKYIVSCNCSSLKEQEMPELQMLVKELNHQFETPHPPTNPSSHRKKKKLADKSTQTSPNQQLGGRQTWLATTSFEQQIRLIDRSLQSELSIRPHKPNSR